MNIEKQKKEAIERMSKIVEKFGLNPNLVKYLQEDKVYYSYITSGGMIPCIDTITYDESYVKKIKEFETKTNCYVYHAIESDMSFQGRSFKFLSLLFVSNNEEDWEMERLTSNFISSYVINLNTPSCSEFGDIFLKGLENPAGNYNVLVRIG